MVDVDTTHLLSIYTGAIRDLYRKVEWTRPKITKLKGKGKKLILTKGIRRQETGIKTKEKRK